MNFGKNSGVHLDCLWQNHGAKKLVMSTEWMEDLFSPMFFLWLQGEHLWCFEEKNMSSFGLETSRYGSSIPQLREGYYLL